MIIDEGDAAHMTEWIDANAAEKINALMYDLFNDGAGPVLGRGVATLCLVISNAITHASGGDDEMRTAMTLDTIKFLTHLNNCGWSLEKARTQ